MSLFGDLSLLLRAARRKADLKQAEVAERAEISQQSLSGYENGKVPPADVLERLLLACGIDTFGKLQQLVDFVEGRGDLREPHFRADDVARAYPDSPADLHRRLADVYEEVETLTRRLREATSEKPKK